MTPRTLRIYDTITRVRKKFGQQFKHSKAKNAMNIERLKKFCNKIRCCKIKSKKINTRK